jgi:tripartite-type tricarboxylate transporter receptor subunit TctC
MTIFLPDMLHAPCRLCRERTLPREAIKGALSRRAAQPNSAKLSPQIPQERAMQLVRRQFLEMATATVAAGAVLPRIAFAQSYPTRPVRIIVGFPAGTSSDITARLIGQRLSERLNQQFIVEDRPGAGTNIAADAVVHAASDGYTLLWVTQTNAINASIYTNLNFNFMRDIAPVGAIMRVPAVVMVHPSVPANTIAEFIAYAKAHPGKINMSTPGIGSINHVAGELFKMMAGVDLVPVHYRSSQFPDLLSGQVQVTFNPLPSSLEFIRSGKLRALAVTSATQQAVLPDVPPVARFLPGYEATAWFGLGAPKATAADVVDKLNREVNAALADQKFTARLHELGGVEFSGTPENFAKFIAAETDKWAKVVKFAGIKPE